MSEYRPYQSPANGQERASRNDPAQLFIDMAERIRRNNPEEFAGAILIVPPLSEDNAADAVEILIVTPHHDEGHFWAVAKGKVDIEHSRWEQAQTVPRVPGGYR